MEVNWLEISRIMCLMKVVIQTLLPSIRYGVICTTFHPSSRSSQPRHPNVVLKTSSSRIKKAKRKPHRKQTGCPSAGWLLSKRDLELGPVYEFLMSNKPHSTKQEAQDREMLSA